MSNNPAICFCFVTLSFDLGRNVLVLKGGGGGGGWVGFCIGAGPVKPPFWLIFFMAEVMPFKGCLKGLRVGKNFIRHLMFAVGLVISKDRKSRGVGKRVSFGGHRYL